MFFTGCGERAAGSGYCSHTRLASGADKISEFSGYGCTAQQTV